MPKSISEAEEVVAYYEETKHIFANRWRPITKQYLLAVEMLKNKSQQQDSEEVVKVKQAVNKLIALPTAKVYKDKGKFIILNAANNKTFILAAEVRKSIYTVCLHAKRIRHLLTCLTCLLCFVCCSTPSSKIKNHVPPISTESAEGLWYPQSEVKVLYNQDTFTVIAVDIIKRKSIIRNKNRQVVKTLDSLKLIEE